jgi:3-methyladenine DNA glycosylase AlkC
VLAELHEGSTETRNLVEWLAIEDARLLGNVLPRASALHRLAESLAATGVMTRVAGIGRGLAGVGVDWRPLARHPSDRVRCYAAYAAASAAAATWKSRLFHITPFAADPHFGVREIAWAAIRPFVVADPAGALRALRAFTRKGDANLRRFASEATRPRGVWCPHVPALRSDPSPGLLVLEPLRDDGSRYVQDSVGNWLNDAAKSRPDWVRAVEARWRRESPGPATARILRRGTRSLPR